MTNIYQISSNSFIDTNNQESINKYLANIETLINKAKQDGKIDKYVLIREDDYFPNNWQWEVSSMHTIMAKPKSLFAYELRKAIALCEVNPKGNLSYRIPVPNGQITEALQKVDINVGKICMPGHFRSTKHFTINTPLEYTGGYNNVTMNRDYTVIDTMDNFLNSGYAYSLAYHDAYLDVTHEPLPISSDACIIINEEKYAELLNNPYTSELLKQRRFIVYKGDLALAINMFLSENGILPSKAGMKIQYDDEINAILLQSIQTLASKNNIDYDLNHGNINGTGGHFSDLLDGMNQEYSQAQNQFIMFLKEKFSQYAHKISFNNFSSTDVLDDIVENYGKDYVLGVVDEYNQLYSQMFTKKYQEYQQNRQTIDIETSNLFKNTLDIVKSIYGEKQDIPNELFQQILMFFHEPTVEGQKQAAVQIERLYNAHRVRV